MINKLINMEVPKQVLHVEETPKGIYSISDYATTFINGMGETQRNRFRRMLLNGIKCGMSVAANYGVEYEPFMEEVKRQMGV